MTATLDQQLDLLLHTRFQFAGFRKGQKDILHSILSGRDTMAVMPTGGGKSLCFQMPALYLDGLVIVITPLIALMKDQVRNLRALGIRAGCLYHGQDIEEKRAIFAAAKSAGSYVLYLSPERTQTPGFSAWLRNVKVALFAIDEAHCVSQWAPEFRPDYDKLPCLREWKPETPILALTATATPEISRDIKRRLGLKRPEQFVTGFYRANLYYQIEHCDDDEQKFQFLLKAIRSQPKGRILLYCGTRKLCEDLSSALSEHSEQVSYYHAGLPTESRTQIQKKYESGEVRILCATNAFGMGMDYPDVRLVVHMQMPSSLEAYYQEVGRAGRDGKKALCLFLYANRDKGLQVYFIKQSKADSAVIRARWRALEALIRYVEDKRCRHAHILKYFHDPERITKCNHCDQCAPNDEFRV